MAAPSLHLPFARGRYRRRGIPRSVAKLGRVRRRETPGGKVRYFLDFGALGRIYKGRDVLGEWDFETPDQAEDYLRRIPCKPDVFAATYEEVNDAD